MNPFRLHNIATLAIFAYALRNDAKRLQMSLGDLMDDTSGGSSLVHGEVCSLKEKDVGPESQYGLSFSFEMPGGGCSEAKCKPFYLIAEVVPKLFDFQLATDTRHCVCSSANLQGRQGMTFEFDFLIVPRMEFRKDCSSKSCWLTYSEILVLEKRAQNPNLRIQQQPHRPDHWDAGCAPSSAAVNTGFRDVQSIVGGITQMRGVTSAITQMVKDTRIRETEIERPIPTQTNVVTPVSTLPPGDCAAPYDCLLALGFEYIIRANVNEEYYDLDKKKKQKEEKKWRNRCPGVTPNPVTKYIGGGTLLQPQVVAKVKDVLAVGMRGNMTEATLELKTHVYMAIARAMVRWSLYEEWEVREQRERQIREWIKLELYGDPRGLDGAQGNRAFGGANSGVLQEEVRRLMDEETFSINKAIDDGLEAAQAKVAEKCKSVQEMNEANQQRSQPRVPASMVLSSHSISEGGRNSQIVNEGQILTDGHVDSRHGDIEGADLEDNEGEIILENDADENVGSVDTTGCVNDAATQQACKLAVQSITGNDGGSWKSKGKSNDKRQAFKDACNTERCCSTHTPKGRYTCWPKNGLPNA